MDRFTPFTLNLRGRLFEADRPQVMGILNVTPDSFYAGSRALLEDEVKARVEAMVADGADMIDIGGCSSRPGCEAATAAEELRRLEVGLRALRSVDGTIPVSVDTFRPEVARVAIESLGADIVNDISGATLADGDAMIQTVARLGVPYVLMHMRGDSSTMQSLTDYGDVVADVARELSVTLSRLELAGVCDVVIDPGFGFAKTTEHCFAMLARLDHFKRLLGRPIMVGVSRKSMIKRTLATGADHALNGSTVLHTAALLSGAASILRVHDVKAAREAVTLTQAIIDQSLPHS